MDYTVSMILIWLGCTHPPITVEINVYLESDAEIDAAASSDNPEESSDTPPSESESPTETEESPCPEGMRPIPTEAPAYCLDIYEVEVRNGVAYSESGRIPSTLFSFQEAQEICESTPIWSEEGEVLAYKRLVTLSEWTDAADGTIGDGGTKYSYGDAWSDSACATPLQDGTVIYNDVQESGYFSECVSEFGIYDQIGNVWEWADPERAIDIDRFFSVVEADGFYIEPLSSNQIAFEGNSAFLWLDVAGAQNQLTQGSDGLLYAAAISEDIASMDFDINGYLRFDFNGPGVAGEFLPIRVLRDVVDGLYPIEVAWERNGMPLTAKAGCAYYVGDSNACRIESVQSSHAYDFLGSIGFRCAVDYPFAEEE